MIDLAPKIVRFAPSPTGRLHIGNIRTALYNALLALKSSGSLVLRLDDTDTARSTREFADFIISDLDWLGIVPDRVERQSERISFYDQAAETLRNAGLLYPCYETPDEIERRRKRLMARGLPPIYDRSALKLDTTARREFEDAGRKPHWRFLLPNFETSPFETRRTEVHFDDIMRGPQTVDLASMSDPVLIRADGSFLYTLPSVVDDVDMGITDIVRGADHVTNSGAQIALFQALGAEPPAFGHHNLLQDASGEGLSKRTGALSIGSLRDDGILPMAVASLATLVGTGQPVEVCDSLEELAESLDFSGISKSDARFDIRELRALNQKIIHSMSYEGAAPLLAEADADLGEPFWLAVRENLENVGQATHWRDVVEGKFEPAQLSQEDREFVAQAAALLPPAPWQVDVWQKWTMAVKEATGRKGRALFMPLRKALTGLEHGPDLGLLLPVIGWERTSRRLS